MKIIISIICLFIMANLAFSNSKLEVSNSDKKNYNKPEMTSLKKENKQTQKNWPPIFYPSEKINADSSVSFPVDI